MTKLSLQTVAACILIVAMCAASNVNQAVGQQIDVISPSIYANTEAPNNSQAWPPKSRVLGIYGSSEFSGLPDGSSTLTELSFRPNGGNPVGEQFGFGRLKMSMAITPTEPGGISQNFENNIANVPVVVYDGPWSATAINAEPPGAETRPFDYRIQLQRTFDYDPSLGNLLVDWIFEDPATPQGNVDNAPPHLAQAMVWTGDLGADSPVANGGQFSVVTEFVFVPEPSSFTLASLAILCMVSCRRIDP